MRFLPVNVDAVLVELDDLSQTLSLFDQLLDRPVADVEDIVPGARTVLIKVATPAALAGAIADVESRPIGARANRAGRSIEIPVTYDGEDLDEVARMLDMSVDEVVARHTATSYSVAFTGFAPGFAYLAGGDARLHVPRRASPRTRVPAGSVALAGPFCGVYPRSSPGGWQLIGSTKLVMWDLERERPALLQPGDSVRFVSVDRAAQGGRRSASEAEEHATVDGETAPTAADQAFVVRRAGLQALFQDLGRVGLAGQGVSRSGAVDRGALRAANRLVGNEANAAAIEIVGGFEIVVQRDAVLAVTGADADVELHANDRNGRRLARHAAFAVCAGDRLRIAPGRAGVRSYLSVRGGFSVPRVLGSNSTDTLAGIGPAPIGSGDRLRVHAAHAGQIVAHPEPPIVPMPRRGETLALDVVLGPRADWFLAESLERLCAQSWEVTHESSRVAIRLAGATPLVRTPTAERSELPSEGVLRGSIQVPPSGQPVLFLADHPLTGGYPVIANVAAYHLDLAGQLPIGAALRFRPVAGAAAG